MGWLLGLAYLAGMSGLEAEIMRSKWLGIVLVGWAMWGSEIRGAW